MTRHYPDLGSASDWSCRSWNLPPPIRSTIQIWVVTRHQWEFLRSFLRRHFAGKPVLASRIVVCFLRLWLNEIWKSCFMLKRMKIDDYTLNINWATGQAYRGGRERRNKEENEHFTSSPLYLRRLSNARYNISTQLFWVLDTCVKIERNKLRFTVTINNYFKMTNRLDMRYERTDEKKILVLLLIIVFLAGKNKKSLVGMAFLKTSSFGVIFIRVFVWLLANLQSKSI